MRPKKPSTLRIASVLTEMASHTVMGIAVGLAFTLMLLAVDSQGVVSLINQGTASDMTRLEFAGLVVSAFAIGTTVTGLAFTFTEEN